ncbi:MAG TPA: DUF5808 domain-containing protein [Candidatus Acidoferrales bacterium]|nr:DUF5808 domain-containing protein [Candidatus Acidoferrales bacterium]
MNSHDSILLAVTLALEGSILLSAILFHVLPRISRRDIFFAVTVNPEFRGTAEGRGILRRFRIAVWSQSAVGAGIAGLAIAARTPLVALVGVGWQVVAFIWAFLRARRQTLPHAGVPDSHREAALVPRRTGGIGFALLQLGPFAILAASAIYIQLIWYRIPERFPIHWGFDGRPNGWATRSFAGIYGLWLIGLLVCAFLEILAFAILHWTRQIRSTGSDAQNEAHFRRVQVGCMIAMEYFFALIFNGIPFTALRGNINQAPSILPFMLGTFGFMAVLIGILIHTGQGGANLTAAGTSPDITGSGKVTGDRTPDQCWRAGCFYVNPDDPAIIVEKRFGIGYTFNFARPAAWLVTFLILCFPVAILVIVFHSVARH